MKILVVEVDDSLKLIVETMIRRAHKKATVVFAHTFKQAVEIIEKNSDIKVVSLNGRFRDDHNLKKASTLQLIPIIREKLQGVHLIACSADGHFVEQLLQAGCDVAVDKFHLAKHLVNLAPKE